MLPLLVIFAQAQAGTGNSGDPIPLIGYGALGVVVMLAVFGKVRFWPEVNRLLNELDKKDAQIDKLQAAWEQVIPQLTSSDRVLEAMKPLIVDLIRMHDEAKLEKEIGRRSSVRLRKEQS